jgi:ketosteroid isomerase-like protein
VPPDLRAIIDDYNGAWNRQDLDAIDAAHAEDVVFENHTAGERAEGKEAVRVHIGEIFGRWPSLRFEGRGELRVGEGFVVSEWTATATTADGERLDWDGIDVFPFEGDKIARKDVYSTSHIARRSEGT